MLPRCVSEGQAQGKMHLDLVPLFSQTPSVTCQPQCQRQSRTPESSGLAARPPAVLLNGSERAALPLQVLCLWQMWAVPPLAVALAQQHTSGLLEKRRGKPVNAVHPPHSFLKLVIYRSGLEQPGALPKGLGITMASTQREHVTDQTKSLFGEPAPKSKAQAADASLNF